ncbi:cleavage and polyadenylation specificity factor subunit 1-like [Limulus polyphemus]|uniref:Cleavage and polyadenylation specificity factor subunit 1-like n=1 Tax=Limulus polyphemus TaxID=6850 RepID=A0ABM1RUB3_LIMPO|nr:cleavage and polyadenylation specificity factor subunit 1-like [Limulus polyphemus]XP_022234968.1 cleavage and polyadenylation specificity factor subunit 1-like [Limulus polyphemus]
MASNMYAFHKQTHPPTGVEHCLYCNFYNMEEHNLIVAQASHLKVFRLVPEAEVSDKLGENDKQPKLKLECTQSFSLHGNIMSLQAVRLTGSPRNALLLSFQEAKLSVVEYDPSTHDLKTLSLHYFEDYDMKGGFTQHYQIPFVRVDPEGRCAAMMVYGKNLVILPFRKDSATEDQDSSLLPGSKSSVLASYTIKLSELDEKVDNIIDLQFLHGYYEPTLLILFEPLKTWPGRVAVRQDTCSMISLSLNIHEKVHPVIWSLSSLPYDCTQALAVPKPIGMSL